MNGLSFKVVVGAFRILRKRAREVEFPGLTVWADAGERVAVEAGKTIAATAHVNECAAFENASLVGDIIADGKVTEEELASLRLLAGSIQRCAERDHDIGEIAAL